MKDEKLISILCPTHKRPELQTRFAYYVYENCSNPENCEIVFGIDSDDEVAIETANKLKKRCKGDFISICLVEPNQKRLSDIVNLCATAARGEILGTAADDVIFRSENWDLTILEEFNKFEDKIMLLWSDDGLWGAQLASHYFVHKNWIRAVGHAQPSHFYADWTDHWIQRLALKLGRAVPVRDRQRLFLEHMHAEHGGMEKDETYYKVKERRDKNNTEGINIDSPELKRIHDAEYEKLKNFIDNYGK
tara:strand:- start:157 stop:900 length:744 start_codon:yes stop_codon:yes gene_type:complete